MDESLIAIANASDPERAAGEHGVTYRDGAVRIEIFLTSADAETPPGVQTVNVRRGDRLDAFVSVENLEAVAERETVTWLQPVRNYDPQNAAQHNTSNQ